MQLWIKILILDKLFMAFQEPRPWMLMVNINTGNPLTSLLSSTSFCSSKSSSLMSFSINGESSTFFSASCFSSFSTSLDLMLEVSMDSSILLLSSSSSLSACSCLKSSSVMRFPFSSSSVSSS